jgi:CRP-like cAMP-binding protein
LKHTIVDKARLLSEVPLLSGVPTEVLADLAALSEVESRPDGDVLFVEGDPADAFYVIIEGSVRASIGDSLVGRAGAGVEIGALAVLDERPRLFTATTETPAVVLRIDGEDFLYLLEQQPRLARGVIRHLASQMRSALGQAEADQSSAAAT